MTGRGSARGGAARGAFGAARAVLAAWAALVLLGACAADPAARPDPSRSSSSGSLAPTATGDEPLPTGGTDPQLPALSILPVGSSEQAITVSGRIRMYRAYRPARLTRFAPLVVMLHGGLGSARQAELAYGWDTLADREGFVVLYPDAIGRAWNVGGGCCGMAPAEGIDDVGFVKAAIADLRARVSLDPARTYAAGMSAGGMMAYRLACDTTLFAAIGPVASTQLGDCPNPAPTSILHVHGTADTSVPYDGSRGNGIAQIDGPSVPALHAAWRGYGRCGGDIVAVAGVVTTTTALCPEGRTVSLVTIEGSGHAWPGVARTGPLDASPSSTGTGTGSSPTGTVTPTVGPSLAPTADPAAYDTTGALWAFFKEHGR